MTMTLFFEYSNFIVMTIFLISLYQVFYSNAENKLKIKESKVYRYMYEIYIVRAGKRKLASFLPWVGLSISTIAVLWFSIGMSLYLINPVQKFENLTEWHGTLKAYNSREKADNIIVFTMEDNRTKSFNEMLRIEYKKQIIGKKVIFWTQRKWGLSDGLFNGELYFDDLSYIILEKYYNENITKKKYEKIYVIEKESEENIIPNLNISLTCVLGFLLLLWFINRKDVKKKVEK